MELSIGQFTVSAILSGLLAFAFKNIGLSNIYKPWIAVLFGIGLGIIAMFYSGTTDPSFKDWIDYIIKGFMTGLNAIGLYELVKETKG